MGKEYSNYEICKNPVMIKNKSTNKILSIIKGKSSIQYEPNKRKTISVSIAVLYSFDLAVYENYKTLIYNGVRYDEYICDKSGNIVNLKTKKFLKVRLSNVGRYYYSIAHNGKIKNILRYRVIAENFIANADNKKEVNHIDGDKTNDDIVNLEWVTKEENVKHAKSLNLYNKNSSNIFIHEKNIYFDSVEKCAMWLLKNKMTTSKNKKSVTNSISRVLSGKRNKYLGLTFKYNKEEVCVN